MKLGKELATARENAGFTQPRAAEKLVGLDKSMLSKIERGHCMLMLSQLECLCMLYDYPQDKALGFVADEYGLKRPKKAANSAEISTPYKLTLRIPRDVATAFLAIVQRRGKRNMQEWLDGYIADAIRRDKKKAAASGNDTDSGKCREKHAVYTIAGGGGNVKTL